MCTSQHNAPPWRLIGEEEEEEEDEERESATKGTQQHVSIVHCACLDEEIQMIHQKLKNC